MYKSKIIDYLPIYMSSYGELGAVTSAEQPELDKIWEEIFLLLKNNFIWDCDIESIQRYEKIVGVLPLANQTLDERKFAVILKMNQRLPYTMRKLLEILTNVCGKDNFNIKLFPNQYYLHTVIKYKDYINFRAIVDMYYHMLPANLCYEIFAKFDPVLLHNINTAYLEQIKYSFEHDNLGFAKILLNGAKKLDGSWALGYQDNTKGLKFHKFIVEATVRQPKRKDNVLLNGKRLLNGEFLLGGDCSNLYKLKICSQIENKNNITSTVNFVCGNYRFLLDGKFKLLGSRKLSKQYKLNSSIKITSKVTNKTSINCYLLATPTHILDGTYILNGSKELNSGVIERIEI